MDDREYLLTVKPFLPMYSSPSNRSMKVRYLECCGARFGYFLILRAHSAGDADRANDLLSAFERNSARKDHDFS